MKGTCHICDKNLASTHGFFIEAPILKSGSPEISPGGVQNEKIENSQTLPESRSG